MRAESKRVAGTGRAWLPLLFCALLLRALVPGGFMFGTTASGSPALVICPEAVPEPPLHHGHGKKAPAEHRDNSCPFGVLAAPALPGSPPLLGAVQPGSGSVDPPELRAGLAASLAAPPPPSTGPPFSSRS